MADRVCPLLAVLAAAALFLPGLGWGLPSRDADVFLFGGRTPWTGGDILAILGDFDPDAAGGVDVSQNPLDSPAVNADDVRRAQVVRRYRLFSRQPDEFATFAALAGMAARRDADPRMYKYGGLFVYPVGAVVGIGAAVGLIDARGDMAYYLDRPEAFGRFYLAGRLYSAAWGLIGVLAVYGLTRRIGGSRGTAWAAAVTFAAMPVVVVGAHEAKPHLAGAALTLWATVKAADFAATGRRRDGLWAGVLCGAAAGMVISAVVAFAVLPAVAIVRRTWRGPLTALLVGLGVFAITNPYLVVHAVGGDPIVRENLAHSADHYDRDLARGLTDGVRILYAGAFGTHLPFYGLTVMTSFVIALVGFGVARRLDRKNADKFPPGGVRAGPLVPLAAVSVATLGYFFLLAAGKPPEYARFGIVPLAGLVVAAAVVSVRVWGGLAVIPMSIVLAGVLVGGALTTLDFVRDGGPLDTRTEAARQLEGLQAEPPHLRLEAEPAPYAVPPFDLWRWQARLGDDDPTAVRVRHVPAVGWGNVGIEVTSPG